MLTPLGIQLFLTALGGVPASARFIVNGARIEQVYPVDAGYPKLGDTDEANDGRGANVLTWRFTVPRGDGWGPTPATEVELISPRGILYRDKIPTFRVSAAHPSILYVNINVVRR